MDFLFAVLSLSGAVALLLWGTHMVQTGVQRAYGPRLRSFLGRALGSRLRSFAAGIGVTALLQSSTATGLMAASFAARGFVDLVPGMAVLLGANVGTALIVLVLSFDISPIAPVLVLIGFVMFRRDSSPVAHDLGRALIGLGLMLLALKQMLGVVAPIEDSEEVRTLISLLATVPALGLLLAALAAWAVHSSVGVVLLIMSLAAAAIVPLDAALAMVLGANLGTAINPLLETPTDGDPARRRLPMGNLLNRAVGALLCLAALGPITEGFAQVGLEAGYAVAIFHLAFNVALSLLMLPLLSPAAKLLKHMLPDRVDPTDPAQPLYLDRSARETPIVALGAAAREALRLADVLEQMLHGARNALAHGNRKLILETRNQDDVLDSLNTAIKRYLTAFDPEDLGDADRRRLNAILAFSMNMEQAGDVIDRNLLPHANKRLKRGLILPAEAEAELAAMMDRLIANLRTAASLFMTEDARAARLLAAEKLAFRKAENAAIATHFDRLRAGRMDIAQSSGIHVDLLRDMKLINSYIVAGAAYPVLDRTGELLPSRLVQPQLEEAEAKP